MPPTNGHPLAYFDVGTILAVGLVSPFLTPHDVCYGGFGEGGNSFDRRRRLKEKLRVQCLRV